MNRQEIIEALKQKKIVCYKEDGCVVVYNRDQDELNIFFQHIYRTVLLKPKDFKYCFIKV